MGKMKQAQMDMQAAALPKCGLCAGPIDMDGYCENAGCAESCAVTATCANAATDWPAPACRECGQLVPDFNSGRNLTEAANMLREALPEEPCRRSLYLVEVEEDGREETTGADICRALNAAGLIVLGDVGAWQLDDFRGGEGSPEQHYRPHSVCRSCGWPFTDSQGETYCAECAAVLTDGDQFNRRAGKTS